MVVFKDPGSVPNNWKPLTEEEVLEAGSSLTLSESIEPEAFTSTHSADGRERRPQVGYCSRCQNGKPPRCHHCSVCKQVAFYCCLRCILYLYLDMCFCIIAYSLGVFHQLLLLYFHFICKNFFPLLFIYFGDDIDLSVVVIERIPLEKSSKGGTII